MHHDIRRGQRTTRCHRPEGQVDGSRVLSCSVRTVGSDQEVIDSVSVYISSSTDREPGVVALRFPKQLEVCGAQIGACGQGPKEHVGSSSIVGGFVVALGSDD